MRESCNCPRKGEMSCRKRFYHHKGPEKEQPSASEKRKKKRPTRRKVKYSENNRFCYMERSKEYRPPPQEKMPNHREHVSSFATSTKRKNPRLEEEESSSIPSLTKKARLRGKKKNHLYRSGRRPENAPKRTVCMGKNGSRLAAC